MSVEFIGFITNNNSSETIVRTGPVLDVPYIETVAKAHELAGFDRALLAFHSTIPDALQVGQHVLSVTKKLKVMIAQRPGFTAPTLLARQLATIDQLSGGRVVTHAPTNSSILSAPNGPVKNRSTTTANTTRSRKAFPRSSPIKLAASIPSSVVAPMLRSRWRASMPTPSRYGANPMPRCAM